MKQLKIALLDLRHFTKGLHSWMMPISLGLLAACARKQVSTPLEIRLFLSIDEYLETMRQWRPDIVGASLYCWNRNLTLLAFRKTREALGPGTLTVLGGPEVEKNPTQQEEFLKAHPYVDVAVLGEGEKPFAEMVAMVADQKDVRLAENLPGSFFLHRNDGSLTVNRPAEKFKTLDEIPSPYLTGIMDPFFELKLAPMLQTSRGCPFTCAFCCMSLSIHNKVRFASTQRFAKELDYCASRLAGHQEIPLYICDSNFGMFPQTIPVVQEIRKYQDDCGWPHFIQMSVGKNRKERIVETSNILKWGMPVAMSAQSLNPPTLEAIKRSNISLSAMRKMSEEVKNPESDSYCELIMNLPEESRETFEKGLKELIDTRVNRLIILTLYLLRGTPLSDPESQRKYGFEVKYRIWPRAFSECEGERIMETEELVVATRTMKPEDYFYLRELQLIINIFYNADVFNPMRRFLWEIGADVWEWLKRSYHRAKADTGKVGEQLAAYTQEVTDELFDSKEDIQRFIEDDDNYQALLDGRRGDNLMNKYLLLSLSQAFNEWMELAIEVAKEVAQETGAALEFIDEALSGISRYQSLMFNFAPYFKNRPKPDEKRRERFSLDINRWMSNDDISLNDCQKEITYELWFSKEKVRQMTEILESGYDESQTRQFIYRDRKFEPFTPLISPVAN